MNPIKMKPEIKAEWLKRLRSGDYKQGSGYLKRSVHDVLKHCCLGVLCEIAVENGIGLKIEHKGNKFAFNGKAFLLPAAVCDFAGFPDNNPPPVWWKERITELAAINDDGISFNTIADLIEDQY